MNKGKVLVNMTTKTITDSKGTQTFSEACLWNGPEEYDLRISLPKRGYTEIEFIYEDEMAERERIGQN